MSKDPITPVNLPCGFCGRHQCPAIIRHHSAADDIHADIACSLARIAKCLEALEKREGKGKC